MKNFLERLLNKEDSTSSKRFTAMVALLLYAAIVIVEFSTTNSSTLEWSVTRTL